MNARATIIALTLTVIGLNPALASICSAPGDDDPAFADWYDVEDGSRDEETWARAVGMLAHEPGDGFCTGTMISDDLFLTAGHCLDECIMAENVCATSGVQFNYQLEGGRVPSEGDMPFFECAEVVECQYGLIDFAIIRLEGSPGAMTGHLELDLREPVVWERITEIHHPFYGPKKVSHGWVMPSLSTYYLEYHADDAGGSSGAPLLDSDGHVIGIDTNSGCDDAVKRGNLGSRVDAALETWLDQIDIEPDPYRIYLCHAENSDGNCTQWEMHDLFSKGYWDCAGDTSNCTAWAVSDVFQAWDVSQVYAMAEVGDRGAITDWEGTYWDVDGNRVDFKKNSHTRNLGGSYQRVWEFYDQDSPHGDWDYEMKTPLARFDYSFNVEGLDFHKSIEIWTNQFH